MWLTRYTLSNGEWQPYKWVQKLFRSVGWLAMSFVSIPLLLSWITLFNLFRVSQPDKPLCSQNTHVVIFLVKRKVGNPSSVSSPVTKEKIIIFADLLSIHWLFWSAKIIRNIAENSSKVNMRSSQTAFLNFSQVR